jgi:hypothetical protein
MAVATFQHLEEKHCISPPCAAYPCFGFTFAGKTKWACCEHRPMLEAKHSAGSPTLPHEQGSLL